MVVNEQFPSLMPTLYPGVLAAVSMAFGTSDAMWLALETLANIKAPAINRETYFSLLASSTGARSSAPSGPRPDSIRCGQGRTLPQPPVWQTGSHSNPPVINVYKFIPDYLDPWLDTASNCGPLEEHPYAEAHAVCMSIQTEDPPLWSGLLSSSARAAALSENRGRFLNCHEDSHSLRQCRHPFHNLNGILNPDLATLGDDGVAFRRWQGRMTRHCHENISRPNRHNHKKHRRRSGHSRGQHQGQGQRNRQGNGYNTHMRNEGTTSLTPAITVVVRSPLPLPPRLPHRGIATVPRIIRTVTPTDVSRAPSAPFISRCWPVAR